MTTGGIDPSPCYTASYSRSVLMALPLSSMSLSFLHGFLRARITVSFSFLLRMTRSKQGGRTTSVRRKSTFRLRALSRYACWLRGWRNSWLCSRSMVDHEARLLAMRRMRMSESSSDHGWRCLWEEATRLDDGGAGAERDDEEKS